MVLADINASHAIAENLRSNATEKSTFHFGTHQPRDFSAVVFDIGASKDNASQSSERSSSKAALLRSLSSEAHFLESERLDLNIDTLADTSGISACEGSVSIDNINDLPTHILVDIFRHLNMKTLLLSVSLVCKQWYRLAHDPDLWRQINLQFQHKADNRILWYLTSLSDRVSYLNLCDTRLISEDCLGLVVEKCAFLQTIMLTR